MKSTITGRDMISLRTNVVAVFFSHCDHRLQCARVCQARVRDDAATESGRSSVMRAVVMAA
ncbi:hypothetical protein IG631_22288 [Alternaria alternata]|nr:hypothetical protein IG631_22288 [Alternaria alternata]